jgi:ribosome-binding factor A
LVVSRRTERVASLIRTLLAEAFMQRLHDPRIPPITSITRVSVSEDFSVARVWVSVLGADAARHLALEGLRHSAGMLRRTIGPELSLRKIPQLVFELDDSLRRSFETIAAIDDAMRELGQTPEWEQDEDAPDTDDAAAPEPTNDEAKPRPPAAEEEA